MHKGRPRKFKNLLVVNDANYAVNWTNADGSRGRCPIYATWKDMIRRCLDEKHKQKYPCYKYASVCTDWLNFMSFHNWASKQDYRGNQLDKDLLVLGNLHYSPETCLFLPPRINSFITDRKVSGSNLTGAVWHKVHLKFMASCRDPFNGGQVHLGYFETEIEAHLAWKSRKYKYACQLADLVDDERIKIALIERYKC
jgi:hypothetical protein